jgi:Domain of unknown function (DUF1931)
MKAMNVATFERFFRVAADLDVDKDDLKRYSEFIFDKTYDMLIIARDHANENGRDVIRPGDLPITKGLQERMNEFRKINEELQVQPFLDTIVARPQLDVTIGEDTEARLPKAAGGISVGLARSFKIIDTKLVNPSSEHWERAFQLFDLLL